MKIMLNHSSATPHTIKSTNNNTLSRQEAGADGRKQGHKGTSKTNVIKRRNGASKTTISSALRRRARSLIKDKSIDAQSRAIIRYGLAANDPLLTELVRRVDAGEPIFDKAGRLIIKTSA
jgi:D-alanyl-D-alanine carboxypeptidase